MPGTDSNSGRCSLLYHLLNSCTCWASISTYTMKIPRPFCAMFPSPLRNVAAIVLPRLVGTRSSRLEPRRDTRHQLGSHLSLNLYRRRPCSFPGVIPVIDIWRAAQLMLKCCGEKALEESAARADELELAGDDDGVTTWRRIMAAVT